MTAREFLLKRFPTNKYWDCPVPKHYWEIMEEYAKAYHEEQKKMTTPAVSKSVSIEGRELLLDFKQWEYKNNICYDDTSEICIIDRYLEEKSSNSC